MTFLTSQPALICRSTPSRTKHPRQHEDPSAEACNIEILFGS